MLQQVVKRKALCLMETISEKLAEIFAVLILNARMG